MDLRCYVTSLHGDTVSVGGRDDGTGDKVAVGADGVARDVPEDVALRLLGLEDQWVLEESEPPAGAVVPTPVVTASQPASDVAPTNGRKKPSRLSNL